MRHIKAFGNISELAFLDNQHNRFQGYEALKTIYANNYDETRCFELDTSIEDIVGVYGYIGEKDYITAFGFIVRC